jgi:hypothetical protein
LINPSGESRFTAPEPDPSTFLPIHKAFGAKALKKKESKAVIVKNLLLLLMLWRPEVSRSDFYYEHSK